MPSKKTETKVNNKKSLKVILYILIGFLIVSLGLINTLRNSIATPEKAFIFLKESQAFENVSELTKAEVRQNYPEDVKNNFLKKALAEKVMDLIITPQNIENISQPGIKAFYRASSRANKLAERTIIVDTASFKNQASSFLPSLGLPEQFTTTTSDVIKSVPDKIVILDPANRKNGVFSALVSISKAYQTLNKVGDIGLAILVACFVLLVLLYKNHIKSIFKPMSILFLTTAILTWVVSYFAPSIASMFIPAIQGAEIASATNNLIMGILKNFFVNNSSYTWVLLAIAAVAYGLHLILNNRKVKAKLNQLINSFKTHKKVSK